MFKYYYKICSHLKEEFISTSQGREISGVDFHFIDTLEGFLDRSGRKYQTDK